MHHRYGPVLEQVHEPLFQVDVLSRADRSLAGTGQPHVLVGELPRDHIFEPRQAVRVQSLGDADTVLHADVAEMVRCQRDLVPDDAARRLHVLAHHVNALIGDVYMGEGMHHISDLQHPLGIGERAGDILAQVNAQVHLQEGEAPLHPVLQPLAHLRGITALRRIAVDTDAVAELAARQLIARHAVGLAGQVHESHLYRTNTASLPRVVSELFDLPEQPVHVTRVLTQETAFQHEGVGHGRSVAHLSQTVYALIRIYTYDRPPPVIEPDLGDPHIGDLEFRRPRIGVDVVNYLFVGRRSHICLLQHVHMVLARQSIGHNPHMSTLMLV